VARALVSVITPTWQRHQALLERCVPSVAAQTYPAVEHVVVSDGPDLPLKLQLTLQAPDVVYAEVPTHDPAARWGHWALLKGIHEATGSYIAYLDDDNTYRPAHLTAVIGAVETTGADFGYSVGLFHPAAGGQPYPVGAEPPSYGQIDTSLIVHRRELLELGTWEQSMPTIDWDLVERWLAAGATWAFVPYVTMDYHFT
jgi:glycosyltransferase involved in cell wall biosynthesis